MKFPFHIRYPTVGKKLCSRMIWSNLPAPLLSTEIATCKQNVGQKEDFMHSNVQMDISLPWIDAAFT